MSERALAPLLPFRLIDAPAAGGGAFARASLDPAAPFGSFLALPPRFRFPAAPDASVAFGFFAPMPGIGRDPVRVVDCRAWGD